MLSEEFTLGEPHPLLCKDFRSFLCNIWEGECDGDQLVSLAFEDVARGGCKAIKEAARIVWEDKYKGCKITDIRILKEIY